MTLVLLGTSNCIVKDSFVAPLSAYMAEPIKNFSIGASSSAVGMYFLEDCDFTADSFVLLDYVINDTGYLGAGLKSVDTIKAQLACIAAAARKGGSIPLCLVMPSFPGLESPCAGELAHLAFCRECGVPFVNLAELFRLAVKGGAAKRRLMRDPSHISPVVSHAVGQIIGRCLKRYRSLPKVSRTIKFPPMFSRRILASQLKGAARVTEHASSLHKGKFVVLSVGDNLCIPIGKGETLLSVMINTGALGATVKLWNQGHEVLKNLTIYWDSNNPAWFTSILVDFMRPIDGSDAGINLTIMEQTVMPSEPTLHGKPVLPGRYGEIEVEGFLVGAIGSGHSLATVASVAEEDLLAAFDTSELLQTLCC